MTPDDINEFFTSEVWDHIKALLLERKESAVSQLRNPSRDAERHILRAQASEIDFVLSIREVIEQDAKEPSNG